MEIVINLSEYTKQIINEHNIKIINEMISEEIRIINYERFLKSFEEYVKKEAEERKINNEKCNIK